MKNMNCLTTTQVIADKKVSSGNGSGSVKQVTFSCVGGIYSVI